MNLNQILTAEQGQRILALALLFLPFLILYLVVISPYLRLLEDKRDRIADLGFQQERLQRAAAQGPHWRKLLNSLKTSQSQNHQYLEGKTPPLASAELQKQMGEIIRQAGGKVTSTQVLTTKPEGPFTRVAVRVRFSANTPALQEILYGIESNQPLLLIEKLSIRSTRGRRRSSRTRQIVPVDKLNVNMQVVGYMATPES